MEEILRNNAAWIFAFLTLLIITVYLIVKIHEWLLRIAVTGLLTFLVAVFYLQYQGYSIINWKKIKKNSQRILSLGKDKFQDRSAEYQKRVSGTVQQKFEEMSGEIQLPKNPDDALETLGSPLKTDIRKKIEQKMTKSNFFSLKSPVPDTGPITGKKEERELRPGKAEFSPQANKKSFSLIEF